MKGTDFPFDPELIAAVEEAFRRPVMKWTALPESWGKIPSGKRNNLGARRSARKREVLAHRDGARCAYCGEVFDDVAEATLDHVIPYRLVRSWTNAHLVLACGTCNGAKSDQVPAVMMPLLSALIVQIVRLNTAPVERSLVPIGGA